MIQIGHRFKAMASRHSTIKQILFTAMATVLVASRLLCSSANAADSSTDWQSEWQRVAAAAKKEGKVVVSVPPGAELRKALKEGFERRFGIELELVTGRGSTIVKKIADEH